MADYQGKPTTLSLITETPIEPISPSSWTHSYIQDADTTIVATESFDSTLSNITVTDESKSPETTIIDRKDNDHFLYLHTCEISAAAWWKSNITAFTQWITSLSKNDTIYIYQTGDIWFTPHIIQALVVMDTLCQAKKIFVVDHIIETPHILLVSDELKIEDTGAVYFTLGLNTDDGKRNERILIPQFRRLYKRAISFGLLSETEVNSIFEDNAIIFKTAREMRHPSRS